MPKERESPDSPGAAQQWRRSAAGSTCVAECCSASFGGVGEQSGDLFGDVRR